MKPLKRVMFVMVAAVVAAAPGYAQGAGDQATAKPPAAQQPPAAPPAAPAAPPAAAKPPAPFPEGAKIAFVNLQMVASTSVEGKAASKKLDDLKTKKNQELVDKNKALQAAQQKLQQGGAVLSDQARGQLEKDIEKMQRDLQFAQQDANSEVQEATQQLQGEFQDRLSPVVEALRAEKGIHIVFSMLDSGIIAADPGLDLSVEVVKRLDAAAKTAPKK
jgi:Skp family chaperone for outer membrane proteins